MGMEVGRVAASTTTVKPHHEVVNDKSLQEAGQAGKVAFDNPPNTQDIIAESLNIKAIDDKQLNEIIEKLNKVFDVLGTELRFKVHHETKEIMVQVVEVQSGQILKEIPPERVLDMIGQMMKMVGLLVDEKA